MNSDRTLFPFYYYGLPVCGNTDFKEVVYELGEMLTGNSLFDTVYNPVMDMNDLTCKVACKKKIANEYDYKIYKWVIDEMYTSTWFADGLPAARNLTYLGESSYYEKVWHEAGIPIGDKYMVNDQWKYKIYNHLTFVIHVHKSHSALNKDGNYYSVVDFNIVPYRYIYINHLVSNILMRII
jgi:hypothetical protein